MQSTGGVARVKVARPGQIVDGTAEGVGGVGARSWREVMVATGLSHGANCMEHHTVGWRRSDEELAR